MREEELRYSHPKVASSGILHRSDSEDHFLGIKQWQSTNTSSVNDTLIGRSSNGPAEALWTAVLVKLDQKIPAAHVSSHVFV